MPKDKGKWHVPRFFAIFTGVLFLLGVLLVFVVHYHQDTTSKSKLHQPPPLPKVPVVTAPAEVCVKAVERNSATVIQKRPSLFYNSNSKEEK
jgi:hypothetical protein